MTEGPLGEVPGGAAPNRLPELGIVALAAALLLPWLTTVPGVSMDEAWIFHRVREIEGGARPLAGMTFYTGALHQYVMWPLFSIFGYSVGTLRGLAVVANLLALCCFMSLSGRMPGGTRTRRRAGILLATTPAFVTMGRFGVELTALSPLLVFAGLLGLRVAADRRKRWLPAALIGGALLGLATYNHFLMIVVPIALSASLLAMYRMRFLRHPATWIGAAAFVAGWSPQLWLVLAGERESWGGAGAGMAGSLDALISVRLLGELPHLPGILAGNWDGTYDFLRYAGPLSVWVPPIPVMVLLVALAFRLRAGDRGLRSPVPLDLVLVAMPTLMVIGTVAITPGLSARFFVVPVALAVLVLARVAPPGRVGAALVGLVVVANLGFLAANYFYPIRRSGGVASVYPLGNQLIESSTTFVDTRQLYAELVEAEFDMVLANEVISGPLSVHDWGRDALNERYWRLATAPPEQLADPSARAAIVYHHGPLSWNRATEVFDVSDLDVIESGASRWRRDPSFDERFRVYVLEPGDGASP